jgi:hypothetical protein
LDHATNQLKTQLKILSLFSFQRSSRRCKKRPDELSVESVLYKNYFLYCQAKNSFFFHEAYQIHLFASQESLQYLPLLAAFVNRKVNALLKKIKDDFGKKCTDDI